MQLSSKGKVKKSIRLKYCFACFPTFLFLSSFFYTWQETSALVKIKCPFCFSSIKLWFQIGESKWCWLLCTQKTWLLNLKGSRNTLQQTCCISKVIHSHSLLHMPLPLLNIPGTLFPVPHFEQIHWRVQMQQENSTSSTTSPHTGLHLFKQPVPPFFTICEWQVLWARVNFSLCPRPAISPYQNSSSNFSIFFALLVFSLLRNDSHQNQKMPHCGGEISLCDFSSFELCPISLLPFIAKTSRKKNLYLLFLSSLLSLFLDSLKSWFLQCVAPSRRTIISPL